jgi:hypothetical protein
LNPAQAGESRARRFSRRNIILYGTLIVVAVYYLLPLYIMVVTSLKGMPEIRLGNIFAPPVEITFEPWVKAWSEACTGLNCDGLSRGFWNSVQITVPSVVASIAIASVNGYALANWRFKGADVFFTILIFGAFIPYQVMLYPIVILLREMGIYGTLWGLVVVHTIFGMPILTLLFPELFHLAARRIVQGGACRWCGILGHLLQDHDADEPADLRGCHHFASDRNLERFPVRCRLHQTRYLPYDGSAQQHRQLCAGREGVQRQHGRHDSHRPGAANRLLHIRQTFCPRHSRRRGERLIHDKCCYQGPVPELWFGQSPKEPQYRYR